MRIISLFLFLYSLSAWSQELSTLLNPSLRMLENFEDTMNPLSCFDYAYQGSILEETNKGPGCKKPYMNVPVGKHRMLNQSGTYKNRQYLLTHPEQNKYKAVINLEFYPADSESGKGTPELANQLLQRTRNCLKEMSPFLKGPNNESLEVIVVTPQDEMPDGVPKPDAIRIKVSPQPKNFRGHAEDFGSSFECVTIGHEILHHLGLCDEYHEGVIELPTGNQDWSCRPVTSQTSYMRNMHFAFNTIIPQTSRCECDDDCQAIMNAGGIAKEVFLSMNGAEILGSEASLVSPNTPENPNREICKRGPAKAITTTPTKAFELDPSSNGNMSIFNSYRVFSLGNDVIYYDRIQFTCYCSPYHPFCGRLIDELKKIAQDVPKRVTCPTGTSAKSSSPSIGSDPSGTRLDECQGEGEEKVCDLVITTPDTGKSLLRPTHFTKILAGNCAGGSPQYERCEPFAYIGAGTELCNQMPKECLDDNYYLNGQPAATSSESSDQ